MATADAAVGDQLGNDGVDALLKLVHMLNTAHTRLNVPLVSVAPGLQALAARIAATGSTAKKAMIDDLIAKAEAVDRRGDPEVDVSAQVLAMRPCANLGCLGGLTGAGDRWEKPRKCVCAVVKYCSRQCQVEDWKLHRKTCRMLQQQREAAAQEAGEEVGEQAAAE